MELEEAIYTRRAIRSFTDEPIDEHTIRKLIDASVQAPSAVNEQPWSFTVIQDHALLDIISAGAKAHMLRTTPVDSLSTHFQQILNDPGFQIFYHGPVLVVISCVADGPWAVIDCSLAAENLMLAARAAGLGSCWIGFAQSWLATPEGKMTINLPPTYLPVAPIVLGHTQAVPFSVPRKQPEIFWLTKK